MLGLNRKFSATVPGTKAENCRVKIQEHVPLSLSRMAESVVASISTPQICTTSTEIRELCPGTRG